MRSEDFEVSNPLCPPRPLTKGTSLGICRPADIEIMKMFNEILGRGVKDTQVRWEAETPLLKALANWARKDGWPRSVLLHTRALGLLSAGQLWFWHFQKYMTHHSVQAYHLQRK